MNWHEEIKERGCRHIWPEEKWYIVGWYEDEKSAYDVAESEWEKKRPILRDVSNLNLEELDAIDIADDYFHRHVVTPQWYLHKDGTWHKLLCNDSFKIGNYELEGEYDDKKSAEEVLRSAVVRPERFKCYQEHLNKAPLPQI